MVIQKFSSQDLAESLYNCEVLTSIEVLHENVYIFYTTKDQLKVYLSYGYGFCTIGYIG